MRRKQGNEWFKNKEFLERDNGEEGATDNIVLLVYGNYCYTYSYLLFYVSNLKPVIQKTNDFAKVIRV